MGHVADSPDVTQQVNWRDLRPAASHERCGLGEAGSSAEPLIEVPSSSNAVACVETHCPVNVTPMRLTCVEAVVRRVRADEGPGLKTVRG